MNNVLFEFYIGDTYTRDFTISDYAAEISEIYFSVKKNITDKRTALQKTLSDGGITLTDITYDDDGNIATRTYNILINAEDTEHLTPNIDYTCDIEIVTPGVNDVDIKKTIVTGTFRLTNATTRYYNEK